MRIVAEKKQDITNDPKPMDRATWQRIKQVVEHEAVHRDWGCALYSLHRLGRIDNDQREAGDRYATLIRDYRKLWRESKADIIVFGDIDVNTGLTTEASLARVAADDKREESEFETRRAKRLSQRYRDARSVAGMDNSALEDLLINDIWPIGEKGHRGIRHALARLSVFFNTGTKRKR